MNVNIRLGEPGDVDAVLPLMRRLAEHEGLAAVFALTRDSLLDCCFGERRRVELIVAAEAGGEIVGYATLLTQFSPWLARDYLFLDDLYVSDAVRGSGIGSRLMRAVGALALERGVGVRWHVETENRPAQAFYRRLGAELRDRLIAYWPAEAIQRQMM